MAFQSRQVKYDDLPIRQKMILDAATRAMQRDAYPPYSQFHVGAAVLTQEGRVISGTNYENASYGLTICAERSAIFTANNQGKRMLQAIAINAKGETFDCDTATGPCGACRQVIYEAAQVSGRNLDVILSTTGHGNVVVTTIADLLPLAFGPADLGIDLAKHRTHAPRNTAPWTSAKCGTECTPKDLAPSQLRLLDEAVRAMNTLPYNPYSRHHVGAAVLAQDGQVITNANFENASYGLTECAERTAIFHANAHGKRTFDAIAVIGRNETPSDCRVVGPCGACRQVIHEASQLSGRDLEVILANPALSKVVVTPISELLPLAFGPADLGIDLVKYRT
jgi:cytidine deaminase